jgi:hypothetical protein
MANGCQAAPELILRRLLVRRSPNMSVAEPIKRNGCCYTAHVEPITLELWKISEALM